MNYLLKSNNFKDKIINFVYHLLDAAHTSGQVIIMDLTASIQSFGEEIY